MRTTTSLALALFASGLGLAACTDTAPIEEPASADEPGAIDDTMSGAARPADDGAAPAAAQGLVGQGPIAYGVISFDGSRLGGTTNWSATYNATLNRYEVAITGESYYYASYATTVTPVGENAFCRTGSISGKLTIYCSDPTGAAMNARVTFTTSKP